MNKILLASNFKLLFIGIVVLDIIAGSFDFSEFRVVTKPLILLSLLIYFAVNGKHLYKATYILMLLALLFSLFGDVFLQFEHYSSNYFIAGLISFLLAHIFYSIIFLKKWSKKTPKNFLLFTILLIGYGSALFFFLIDDLGALKIPVVFYILGILLMAVTALRRSETVGTSSFMLVLIGAFCFVASDSILAIHKFMFKVPYSHFLVMGSYAAAQYLIVSGILKQNLNRKN